MISINPEKRPDIEEILTHPWFEGIPNLNEEQLKEYEKKINLKEEFENRKKTFILDSIKELYDKSKFKLGEKNDINSVDLPKNVNYNIGK